MGGAVKKAAKVATAPVTGGASLMSGGGLKDTLLGKQQTRKASPLAPQIFELQKKGIKGAGTGFDTLSGSLDKLKGLGPATGAVRKSVARQEKGLLASADDQRRKVQESLARRGLGGSSLGMRAESGISRSLGDSMSALRSTIPERMRQAKLGQIQSEASLGGNLLSAGQGLMPRNVQMRDVNLGRKGGLLGIAQGIAPIAGAGMGAMSGGGPAGAAKGAQMGAGVGAGLGGFRTMFA